MYFLIPVREPGRTKLIQSAVKPDHSRNEIFPSIHRSHITAKLWEQRKKEQEKHISSATMTSPVHLVPKTPEESHIEIHVRNSRKPSLFLPVFTLTSRVENMKLI